MSAVPERATRAPEPATHCALEAANPDRPLRNLNARHPNIASIGPQARTPGDQRCIFPHHVFRIRRLTIFTRGFARRCALLIISIAGPSPRKRSRKSPKGIFHGTLDRVSHRKSRRPLHLLPRSRPERRTNASPPPRTPLLIANVRASLRPPFRSLPPHRARLSRLRSQ